MIPKWKKNKLMAQKSDNIIILRIKLVWTRFDGSVSIALALKTLFSSQICLYSVNF